MSDLQIEDLKSPAKGLAAVLGNLAAGIRTDLAALPDDSATRIHDIRVRSKKLWSLSKLARRHSDKALTREFKSHLREVKNAFSGSRDQEVMRTHLLELLPGEHGTKTCEAAGLSPVAGEAESVAPPKTVEHAEKLGMIVRLTGGDALTMHDLCHRFARSYRVAQKAMAAAHEDFDDELMHDWRKKVKDLFYQACALRTLEPADQIVQPLDDLADTLGRHHDMAILLAHLKRHETSDEAKEAVLKEKELLERAAYDQGKDLLGRKATDLEEALDKAAGE